MWVAQSTAFYIHFLQNIQFRAWKGGCVITSKLLKRLDWIFSSFSEKFEWNNLLDIYDITIHIKYVQLKYFVGNFKVFVHHWIEKRCKEILDSGIRNGKLQMYRNVWMPSRFTSFRSIGHTIHYFEKNLITFIIGHNCSWRELLWLFHCFV